MTTETTWECACGRLNPAKFERCINCREDRRDAEEGPADDPLAFYLSGLVELQERYGVAEVPRVFGAGRLTMEEVRHLLQKAETDLQTLLRKEANDAP